MALFPCPECAGEISSQAKECPHCGFPIRKSAWSYVINWIEHYKNSPPELSLIEIIWVRILSIAAIVVPFWLAPDGATLHWIAIVTIPLGVAGFIFLAWLSAGQKK